MKISIYNIDGLMGTVDAHTHCVNLVTAALLAGATENATKKAVEQVLLAVRDGEYVGEGIKIVLEKEGN